VADFARQAVRAPDQPAIQNDPGADPDPDVHIKQVVETRFSLEILLGIRAQAGLVFQQYAGLGEPFAQLAAERIVGRDRQHGRLDDIAPAAVDDPRDAQADPPKLLLGKLCSAQQLFRHFDQEHARLPVIVCFQILATGLRPAQVVQRHADPVAQQFGNQEGRPLGPDRQQTGLRPLTCARSIPVSGSVPVPAAPPPGRRRSSG
jgi:hypothetical protein